MSTSEQRLQDVFKAATLPLRDWPGHDMLLIPDALIGIVESGGDRVYIGLFRSIRPFDLAKLAAGAKALRAVLVLFPWSRQVSVPQVVDSTFVVKHVMCVIHHTKYIACIDCYPNQLQYEGAYRLDRDKAWQTIYTD